MSSDREVGRIIPNSTLEQVKTKLKSLILEEPEEAIEFMKSDPVATVAFSKLRNELIKQKSSDDKVKEFLHLIETETERIMDIDVSTKSPDELVFVIEMLVERWGQEFVNNQFTSLLDFIETTVDRLAEAVNPDDASLGNRIAIEMLNDFHKRARSLENYQRKKFREHWNALKEEFQNLIEKMFEANIKDKKISDEVQAMLYLATMSPIVAKEFRSQLALLIFDNIYPRFNELQEEYKYLIAPWLKALEENAKTIKEELEEEKLPDVKQGEKINSEDDEFFN
ncbi:MAG: hypothetical protein D6732_26380 [Methanobacteriota archaeon]|nr:MAG: hypothetical protein D6732_26380 [Euryarchaeota archaeon]